MGYTNARIQKVKPSETLAVKARAAELKAQGRSIIDFSTGEPDIDTPEHIKEGARKALVDGKTKYTAVNGIPELRTAIAEKLTKENKIAATPETVIVTNGGKQALDVAFEVILEPGDEVIIPAPYWVSYPPMVELAGGKPVIIKTDIESRYKITPDQLKAALTPKTKCVVFNSPSNPTGMGYTAKEITELAKVLANHSTLIISDEVYEKLTFDGYTFKSFAEVAPELASRVVTVNAFSKTYSMTGWRVGYATGPKEIIAAMGRYQSQSTSNVCSIAQYAALAALKGPHDFIASMITSFQRRMKTAIEILGTAPGLGKIPMPDGAFYLFIPYDKARFQNGPLKLSGSAQFTNMLLEKAGVAAVAGEAFGDDAAFRISVGAADDQIKAGAQAIATALREIQ